MPTFIADTVGPYIEHLRGQGLAADYIRYQRSVVAGPRMGFLGVVQKLKGPRPTCGQIDAACVDRYFSNHSGGLNSRTNKLQVLRRYLGWLEGRGLLRPGLTTEKLFDGYKSRREDRRPKYYIPAEDFPSLLSVAHDPRDRAVLAIGLYTLARQGEIASLTLKQAAEADKTIKLYREKRKRWTDSPVSRELRRELDLWLKVYADKMGYESWRQMAAEHPDWFLVPSKHSNPYSWTPHPDQKIDRMEAIPKLALTDLGVTETVTGIAREHLGEGMHTIRRSGARAFFARLVKSAGYESALTFVQAMLDHETQDMTLRYIGLDWVKEQLNEWVLEHGMYE